MTTSVFWCDKHNRETVPAINMTSTIEMCLALVGGELPGDPLHSGSYTFRKKKENHATAFKKRLCQGIIAEWTNAIKLAYMPLLLAGVSAKYH